MGRKKSKRKPQKTIRRIQALKTLFECPFCNHESSCDVKFDRKRQRAQIVCRICSETYETDVNCKPFSFSSHIWFNGSHLDLSEAIDVYNAWIDACEEANKNQGIIS